MQAGGGNATEARGRGESGCEGLFRSLVVAEKGAQEKRDGEENEQEK